MEETHSLGPALRSRTSAASHHRLCSCASDYSSKIETCYVGVDSWWLHGQDQLLGPRRLRIDVFITDERTPGQPAYQVYPHESHHSVIAIQNCNTSQIGSDDLRWPYFNGGPATLKGGGHGAWSMEHGAWSMELETSFAITAPYLSTTSTTENNR